MSEKTILTILTIGMALGITALIMFYPLYVLMVVLGLCAVAPLFKDNSER